jgi:hypothetical protein
VEKLVVQSVGEAGGSVLVNGHGGIVREVGIVQHLEHFVASNLSQKKSPTINTKLNRLIFENKFIKIL